MQHPSRCNTTKEKRAQLHWIKTDGLSGSSRKISWMAVLLMYSSTKTFGRQFNNFVAKYLGLAQCFWEYAWRMDGRISHHLQLSPAFHENAYAINKRARDNASPSYTCCINLQVSVLRFPNFIQNSECSIFARPLARIRLIHTYHAVPMPR
jgi:hypothetical protein